MREELGLKYNVHPCNIGAGDQFKPDFLKISPNNKMPAIVDPDGPDGQPISLFESGAILIYLAEKHGKFLSDSPRTRYETLQWLMWQMGGLGPMLGQAHHFRNYAPERIEYAYDRYTNEANRLYRVLDKRLGEARYLEGEAYPIADIAARPLTCRPENQAAARDDLPNYPRPSHQLPRRPPVEPGLQGPGGL